MTIRELAKHSNMSWITARKYAEKLKEMNIVTTTTETKASNEKITFNYTILQGVRV